MPEITIKTKLTFEHVSGPESDADTLLDAFAFDNGQQNGAGPDALITHVGGGDDEDSVYRLKLVDD